MLFSSEVTKSPTGTGAQAPVPANKKLSGHQLMRLQAPTDGIATVSAAINPWEWQAYAQGQYVQRGGYLPEP
jgi:hypothetical protein